MDTFVMILHVRTQWKKSLKDRKKDLRFGRRLIKPEDMDEGAWREAQLKLLPGVRPIYHWIGKREEDPIEDHHKREWENATRSNNQEESNC